MSGMNNFYPGTGTTLCPHCDTRFRIAEAQLEAHHGMVRCGHCLQAFDARPNFVSDQPSPQLELPILDEPISSAEQQQTDGIPALETPSLVAGSPEGHTRETYTEVGTNGAAPVEPMDGTTKPAVPHYSKVAALQHMTLAEQVAIVQDEDNREPRFKQSTWPWAIAALLLLLVLFAQAAYFFRVDLAARLPGLKPSLISYCQILECSVPLPQETELIGIESSDLEADPVHENQITLNALLRNRASYTQAFPDLELTLNDIQDKPLARRIFRPADYLPSAENEKTGLQPNHEFSIKLHLNTTDLKPTGYRLALYYPVQ